MDNIEIFKIDSRKLIFNILGPNPTTEATTASMTTSTSTSITTTTTEAQTTTLETGNIQTNRSKCDERIKMLLKHYIGNET